MSLRARFRRIQSGIAWNILLITVGGCLFAVGVKAIAQPHGFLSGGLYGTGLLIFYGTGWLSPPFWYFVLNIPLFVLGWRFLGPRFFWYSLYGMLVTTLASQFINFELGIQNHMLAAIATGICSGAGTGIVLRSLGSDGGLSILSIWLHNRHGWRVGQVSFLYNLVLFLFGLVVIHIDRVLYSVIIVFITSQLMDYFMSLFNQRKMALIISAKYEDIAEEVLRRLGRGATLLHGSGAFTHKERVVLLVVVNNYQLKRLEELVFRHDPDAFVIIENTFNVLGMGFSQLRKYG